MTMTPLTINWQTFLNQMNQITALSAATPGQNRLVYTPNWVAAQQALIQFGQTIGLQISVDDYGTVYLDLPGQTTEPAIATGSHMDTVANGGRYDGLYGVLGGLHAIATLQQTYGQPKRPLRLIAFSEEEGSRFPTTFSGSKHYTGLAETDPITDPSGVDFSDARIPAVQQLLSLPGVTHQRPTLPASFTELHIEQGPRLIQHHAQIGLVTGIVGQRRFTVTVTGTANHAGTTPMDQRHDALQAAVDLIHDLAKVAQTLSPSLTFTVGQFNVSPNTANVIPGQVIFTIDCRHTIDGILDQFEMQLTHMTANYHDHALTITVERWVHDRPVQLADHLCQLNQKLADQLGLSSMQLASGAGHDSMIMSQFVPTTMLFVPSIDGISHAPEERTELSDLQTGINLLTASLHAQAY